MSQRLIRAFALSGGALLLGAALVRFLILLGNSPQLHHPEPLLGIPLPLAILLVGIIELGVASICLFGSRPALQAALLAWVSLNYLVFRVGAVSMGVHWEWTCLGALTDPLLLARGTSGFLISFVLPSGLLFGSFAALIWPWFCRVFPPASAFNKMPCPACGGHIKFAVTNLDRKNPCPHCQTVVTLRKPEDLKIFCFFCKEHIEFPAHALGRKIDCPHCKRNITLQLPDLAL